MTAKHQLITAEHDENRYEVNLTEIMSDKIFSTAAIEVGKYMEVVNPKIKTFEIKGTENKTKYYTVAEKVSGMNLSMFKFFMNVPGFQKKYFNELGKIVAFAYVCALPDRGSENIVWIKTENTIKLMTFDFDNAFDYVKHPPVACAQKALDSNILFFGKNALSHGNDLKEGFVGAFNSAKNNRNKIFGYIREFKGIKVNADVMDSLKKMIDQDPQAEFNKIMSCSRIFKGKF
jgi:hypothetical protein